MTRFLCAVAVVAVALSGCGKKNTAKKPGDPGAGPGEAAQRGEPTAAQRAAGNDLKKLATAYHDYLFKHNNKPPATAGDLSAFAPGDLIGKVQNGTYILHMNVDVYRLPGGATNTVLGYERNVPTEGGVVVMADGSTPYMTKEEFAAATKGGR